MVIQVTATGARCRVAAYNAMLCQYIGKEIVVKVSGPFKMISVLMPYLQIYQWQYWNSLQISLKNDCQRCNALSLNLKNRFILVLFFLITIGQFGYSLGSETLEGQVW